MLLESYSAKISDLCARAGSFALVLARLRPRGSKKRRSRSPERERASVNIVLSACGSYFPPSLLLSSFSFKEENLEWIDGFGFCTFMRHCTKKQPFRRSIFRRVESDILLTTLKAFHSLSRFRSNQTCQGTRLAKVKSWEGDINEADSRGERFIETDTTDTSFFVDAFVLRAIIRMGWSGQLFMRAERTRRKGGKID